MKQMQKDRTDRSKPGRRADEADRPSMRLVGMLGDSSIVRDSRLRVLYALGPGDVVEAYRHWRAGKEVESEMSVPFSAQFLDWCESTGATAHLVSWNTKREVV